MKVTVALRAQHIGNMFKYLWLIQARKKIREDGTKAVMESRGIHVVKPNDILSPPFTIDEELVASPTLEESLAPPPPKQHETPCNIFTNFFSPVMGIAQVQVLTNTLVRTGLPQTITDNAAAVDTTPELKEKVKDAIFHSHLMDSYQTKLPRIYDVVNHPGWVFPREYGIPLQRKNKSLTYQLLLLLDQVEGCGLGRQLIESPSTQVLLHHGDRLMQLRHHAGFLVSSPDPLPPPVTYAKVEATCTSEELPDIYPMSPFINSWAKNVYSLDEYYAVDSPQLYPHTLFVHHNQPRMPHTEASFTALTLLHGFSHAAAYAKLVQKQAQGDLDEPVTVQVVHTNNRQYHLGVYQLNTLTLTPSHTTKRNLFWTQEWDTLFDKCHFKAGRPILEGYNSKIFDLLRGFHAQG